MYYTYAYLREDGTPYYIGKGKGQRCYRKGNRNAWTPKRDRILKLKTGLTEEEAYKHEIYMISLYGRKRDGGILHNVQTGGQGANGRVVSEEEKKDKSEMMKRRWKDDRDKMIKIMKKRPPRQQSDEERRRRSEYMKKNNPAFRQEVRDKIRNTLRSKFQ